jgi:Domain of unknown function (DUF222)/HNH endonuclease
VPLNSNELKICCAPARSEPTVHLAMARQVFASAASSTPADSTIPSSTVMTTANLAAMSTEEIMELVTETSSRMASLAGLILQLAAELDRREGWRSEGATSLENWIVQRCGVSVATARAWAHVAGRLFDLPHLAGLLATGDLTFDKVRAVADSATPETDAELSEQARHCTVRELAELGRAQRGPAPDQSDADYESRSVRFNDNFRTVTAQLPPESYAEVRTCLETRAKDLPSDGETRWDQRLCDALLHLVRGGSSRMGTRARAASSRSYLVVAHTPVTALLDEENEPSTLCASLESNGLISVDTLRRVACDATIVIAVDDDVGHTMYEGRARRFPTGAQRREIQRRDRQCRFPGCTNATFTDVHHVKPWVAARGCTDLDNLVLLCEYHHRQVHSRQWSMTGDANVELTFVGPTGRPLSSPPSPLWTAVGS